MATYRLSLDSLGGDVERVVLAGRPTLSRPVTRLLARADVEVVRLRDDARTPEVVGPSDGDWLRRWRAADLAARKAVDGRAVGGAAERPRRGAGPRRGRPARRPARRGLVERGARPRPRRPVGRAAAGALQPRRLGHRRHRVHRGRRGARACPRRRRPGVRPARRPDVPARRHGPGARARRAPARPHDRRRERRRGRLVHAAGAGRAGARRRLRAGVRHPAPVPTSARSARPPGLRTRGPAASATWSASWRHPTGCGSWRCRPTGAAPATCTPCCALRSRPPSPADRETAGQPSRASRTGTNLAWASRTSASGSDPATIPHPAKSRAERPDSCAHRSATPHSPSPRASTQPTGPA